MQYTSLVQDYQLYFISLFFNYEEFLFNPNIYDDYYDSISSSLFAKFRKAVHYLKNTVMVPLYLNLFIVE